MDNMIIEIEYRRGLADGIYRARLWENGNLIPEEEFIREFSKNYIYNGFRPEIKILYGGVSIEEAINFREELERIIDSK